MGGNLITTTMVKYKENLQSNHTELFSDEHTRLVLAKLARPRPRLHFLLQV